MSGDWDAAAHVRFLREQGGSGSGYTADLIDKQREQLSQFRQRIDLALALIASCTKREDCVVVGGKTYSSAQIYNLLAECLNERH